MRSGMTLKVAAVMCWLVCSAARAYAPYSRESVIYQVVFFGAGRIVVHRALWC